MRQKFLIAALLFVVGLSVGSIASTQEKPASPAHQWLNGKWEGPAPGGGLMELDLRVINDNQVTGSGQVRLAAKGKGYRPTIVGSVSGDRVVLDLQNPSSGNNVKLDLVRTEGVLKGMRKGEEVVYRKLE